MTLLCCELSTRCAISSLFLKVAIFTPALDLVFFVFFIFLFFEEDDFGMWILSRLRVTGTSGSFQLRSERRLSPFWDFQHIMQVISIMPPTLYYWPLITFMVFLFFTVLWPNRKMTDIAFWYLHQMIRMGEIPEWASLLWQWQNTQKLNFWRPNRDLEIFPSSINLHSVTHCFT